MLILGFQKMTLLDYPGKVACTIFTGGCNFRCPFCHNALLVTEIDPSGAYDEKEILKFLKTRTSLLDGVCITGGEPLVQDGIEDFMREIKNLGFKLKLDTNGSFPERLEKIVAAGLIDYVAVDVKNTFEKYAETVGIKGFDASPIKKTLAFLAEGKVDYELRTTVVKEFHTEEDVENIAKTIQNAPRYFLQNFTDSGNLIGDGLHAVAPETLKSMQERAKKHLKNTFLRGI